jgi:hypothetical protein
MYSMCCRAENFNHRNYLPMSEAESINVSRLEIKLY